MGRKSRSKRENSESVNGLQSGKSNNQIFTRPRMLAVAGLVAIATAGAGYSWLHRVQTEKEIINSDHTIVTDLNN